MIIWCVCFINGQVNELDTSEYGSGSEWLSVFADFEVQSYPDNDNSVENSVIMVNKEFC